MLPVWFWILLWAVLVLVSLLAAVLAGYRLFRKGLGVMHTLGAAADKAAADFAHEGTVVDYVERSRVYPSGSDATHADPAEARRLQLAGRAERIEARRVRRVARRTARRQPQNVYDVKLF